MKPDTNIRRMRRAQTDPKRSRESRQTSRSIRAYFELLGRTHAQTITIGDKQR